MLNITHVRRLADGLCRWCGGERGDGSSPQMCAACKAKAKASQQKMKFERRCRDCGEPLCDNDPGRCVSCRAKHKVYHAARRAKLKEEGRCVRCSSEAVIAPGKQSLCEICFFKATALRNLGSGNFWKLLAESWRRQQGVCPYTRLLIRLGVDASLDHAFPVSRFPEMRCDPGNLQWVHYRVNEMKKDWTHDEFLAFLRLIVR